MQQKMLPFLICQAPCTADYKNILFMAKTWESGCKFSIKGNKIDAIGHDMDLVPVHQDAIIHECQPGSFLGVDNQPGQKIAVDETIEEIVFDRNCQSSAVVDARNTSFSSGKSCAFQV